jgi:serine acetyltransferase
MSLRRYLVTSNDPFAVFVRRFRKQLLNFTLPAPKFIFKPLLLGIVSLRSAYYYLYRILWAEPLFKAYLTSYGKGVRTGNFLHWVTGKGDMILGDHVWIDGKCGFAFSQRFTPHPTFRVGDYSEIGHGCGFVIAKEITIGKHTRISFYTQILDSSGHPIEADLRRQNLPPHPSDVKPVIIGDDVWIGQRCLILPGTRIGDGCIVSAGSVVRGKFPPYSLIAGNPAKVIASLPRPVEPDTNTPLKPESAARTQDGAPPVSNETRTTDVA